MGGATPVAPRSAPVHRVPWTACPKPNAHGPRHLRCSTALSAMITWGFINIAFGWHPMWLYSWLGAILFCGFILFDTWMIMQRCARLLLPAAHFP